MGTYSVQVGDHCESPEHLPPRHRVGRPGVADPPFASLTARGADPRCESYRYGWGFWAPQPDSLQHVPETFVSSFIFRRAISLTFSVRRSMYGLAPAPRKSARGTQNKQLGRDADSLLSRVVPRVVLSAARGVTLVKTPRLDSQRLPLTARWLGQDVACAARAGQFERRRCMSTGNKLQSHPPSGGSGSTLRAGYNTRQNLKPDDQTIPQRFGKTSRRDVSSSANGAIASQSVAHAQGRR
jgi:hypothetical protein